MKHLFLLFFLLTPILSAGQATGVRLRGLLTDSATTKPVPFATVALQATTGQLLTGATTDDRGAFAIDNVASGTYQLVISSVGYRTKTIDKVIVTPDKPVLELGTITLASNSRNLNEVQVVGQKAMVEDKGDRLVYNAENDATNTGGPPSM